MGTDDACLFVEEIYQGTASREDAQAFIERNRSCFLKNDYHACVIRNYANSLKPTDESRPSEEELHQVARECNGLKSTDTVFKRLQDFYDPKKSSCQCQYCIRNNECMASGCTKKTLDSATSRNSTSFRCTPGGHLCSKHGLLINVNRKTCATLHTLVLKDGRIVQNVWRSQSGVVARKRCRSNEDSIERFNIRRKKVAQLEKYIKRLNLESMSADDGINKVIAFLANPKQS